MKYKRPDKPSTEIRETNRKRILKALEEKRELTFIELLDLHIVSRGALNIHLKALLKKQDIEKRYSKTKDKLVYCLTNQSEVRLYVESVITTNLGLLGITYITRKNMSKPIHAKYDVLSGIETLLLPEKPKAVSWKQVLNYLEKEHWCNLDLTE